MRIFKFLKIYLVLIFLLFISSNILAQVYSIGHISTVFYDNARNRNINTEIYYPADSNGNDVPVSFGDYPVIVFGHGFLISWDSYENFWTSLVPDGYILCFPTTEMGFVPNHQFFADDLRFISSQMQIESQNSSSIFYNSVSPKTGMLGHSMGGGASFLATENNPNINTLINFAAAETNPSAISKARNITIPTVIFSGEDDCVTPPINHQNVMFDSLNSNCKTQINIINGGHCYFANDNVLCNFGESSCNPNLNITREKQQSITNDFLKIWLNFSLKSNLSSFNIFNDSLQTSNRISYTQFCNGTGLFYNEKNDKINIYPNPVIEKLNIEIPFEYINGEVSIYNIFGQKLYNQIITTPNTKLDISSYETGSYYINYKKDDFFNSDKIIKIVHHR